MRIMQAVHRSRLPLGLGLLGLLTLASGCGSTDPNTQPAAPATTQAQQDAERAAREKAYGNKQGISQPAKR